MNRLSLHKLQSLTLLWSRLAFVLVLLSALTLPVHLAQHELSPDKHPIISCELCHHAQPLDALLPQFFHSQPAFYELAPHIVRGVNAFLAQTLFLPPARGPPTLLSY